MSDQPPVFNTKLVGLGHRNISEQSYVLGLDIGDHMLIEREPENPYDVNAIKFVPSETPTDAAVAHLGYVAAKHAFNVASEVAPWMDKGFHFMATIIPGGTLKSPNIELTPIAGLAETVETEVAADA